MDKSSHPERLRAALHTLWKRLLADFNAELDNGLTASQFYILCMIREKGPCKVTRLAKDMDVKPSAITVMIDRLVNQTYVERLAEPNDRRVVLLRITDAGLRKVEELESSSNARMETSFNKLSADEVEHMIRTLEKMNRND